LVPYDQFIQAWHQQCLQHLQRRCQRILSTAVGGAVHFPRAVLELVDTVFAVRRDHRAGLLSDDQSAATVWRARQRGSATDCMAELALKVLDQRHAENPVHCQRFEQEARLARSLVHSHIVPVLDVAIPPQVALPLYVMPFLPGGHIGQFRGAPANQFPAVRQLLIQVCEALRYIHTRGLVHCDVKASNILLDGKGNAFLADFGMTATPEELSQTGSRGGTILYMSPEHFASLTAEAGTTPPVDGRSDIYSMGVLMYELFTGEPPFRASNRYSLMYQRLTTEPRPPAELRPDVSPGLSGAILKALTPDPAERFPTVAELSSALLVES
jgi:serine/threonine protein kinase